MPAPEVSHRYQPATLFPWIGVDRHGKHVVGAPREIIIRFNAARKTVKDGKGNTITLDGTGIVNEVLVIGSRLWLGELAEWYGTGSSIVSRDQEIYEIATYNDVPDVKTRFSQKTIGVMRLHNKG